MSQGYAIFAHSPSLNQTVREMDLANLNTPITAQVEAQQRADAFAGIYNRDRKLQTSDWQGKIEWQEFGEHTIPGYRG
jgi:hypothetical protein